MPKKYDSCVRDVKKKIKFGEIKKTFICDSQGKPNKRGRKSCRSNAYAICRKVK